jgi:hypothetical protein
MRYAVATNLEDERVFYRGPFMVAANAGGGLDVYTDLHADPQFAYTFENRAAAAICTSNLGEFCAGFGPGAVRTWFVVELPEPRA